MAGPSFGFATAKPSRPQPPLNTVLGGMELSIQDWGAIGEILGAIGVIATLIYLAKQIRTNTKTTQGATANAILRDARELLRVPFSDRESADLFLRGMENFDSLDDVERAMFTNRAASFFRICSQIIRIQ